MKTCFKNSILGIVLILALLMSSPPFSLYAGIDNAAAAIAIVDVEGEQPSPWAEESVSLAIDAELVPLHLQSQYTRAATRAEFSALAVTMYETAAGAEITGRQAFEDTEDENVEKAAAIGIVVGVGNNRFDPEANLTREQAAVMLSRLAAITGSPLLEQAASFADNDSISEWAFGGVGQVQAAGIMFGVGDNTFAPQDIYTREQCIVTILRLYSAIISGNGSGIGIGIGIGIGSGSGNGSGSGSGIGSVYGNGVNIGTTGEDGRTVGINEWKQAYIAFIQENAMYEGTGILPSSPTFRPTFHLAHINDDDIPELIIMHNDPTDYTEALTYLNGDLDTVYGRYPPFYIERGNLLRYSGGNMGNYYELFYTIQNGKFTLLHEGAFGYEEPLYSLYDDGYDWYKWDGAAVSEEEYEQLAGSVFGGAKGSDYYSLPPIYTDEMIKIIENY
ncbi:MAG: S-layer homology domain-containing protein [Oscillospiraceae bacterium]|nr:S-layer homology domain-containing protein [Oscillospiraceae bacterium]